MGVTTLAKAGNSDLEVVQYTDLSSRPTAESFGVGQCQITTATYSIISTSNGSAWHSTGSCASLANRPSAASFGVGTIHDVETGYDHVCDGVSWGYLPTATYPSVIAGGVDTTGAASSSSAIQALIDANPGAEIYFPAGSYLIDTPLTYYNTSGVSQPKGFKIRGAGRGITKFLNRCANGSCFDINTGVGATAGTYFFSYAGYFKDLSISGTGSIANSNGIKLRSCGDYKLERVDISNHTNAGIYIDNDSGINPDYTASGLMKAEHVRITYNKYGIYSPYANGFPTHHFSNCYIAFNTQIGVYCCSTYSRFTNTAIAYNGSAYSGTGDPDITFGGYVTYNNAFYPKGIVFEGCELDNNKPQQVFLSCAHSPIIRNCNIQSTVSAGYVNKYSLIFGEDTSAAGTYVHNFRVEDNTFSLPVTLASSGLTHTFVYAKKFTRRGLIGDNTYSIAGGSIGTEILFIQEDVKNTGFTGPEWRTRFRRQNGSDVLAAYATQYHSAISDIQMATNTAIALKPPNTNGVIAFNCSIGDNNYGCLMGYTTGAGDPSTYLVGYNTSAGAFKIEGRLTSTQLTGTTGTAGRFTISSYVTDGKIYFENRLGGTIGVTIQFLSGVAGFDD